MMYLIDLEIIMLTIHIVLYFSTGGLHPYSSELFLWYWGNHVIASVPVKQPW